MIQNQDKSIINKFSGQGPSHQMTLDKDSLAHIMSVLTNLYSNPTLAVIREYTTNAYDSHVSAGKSDVPVEITLPDVFNPSFVVKDFGVGLSETEVFEVFGSYGKSTKRESNDLIGALGLGCKSALTFTNQFSLTAIKDGKKGIYSVHLDEYGVGKITQLHSSITDESNGVEISIPVKHIDSFLKTAREFYRFFTPRPIFINGDTFEKSLNYEISVDLGNDYKILSFDANSDLLRMGGIAYPFNSQNLGGYGYRQFNAGTLLIDAPMGAVDFVPSRETLHFTKRTIEFIKGKVKEAKDAFLKKIKDDIDGKENIIEAYNYLSKIRSDLPDQYKEIEYKGFKLIPAYLYQSVRLGNFVKDYSIYACTRGDNYTERGDSEVAINMVNKTLVIETGGVKISNYLRGCITTVARNDKSRYHYYLLLVNSYNDVDPLLREVLDATVLTLDQARVLASRYRKELRVSKQKKFEEKKIYEVVNTNSTSLYTSAREIDPAVDTIVYGVSTEYKHLEPLLLAAKPDVVLVKLRTNQVEKFSKKFTTAIKLNEFIQDYVSKTANTLTDKELSALGVQKVLSFAYTTKSSFSHVIRNPKITDLSKIADDDLKDFMRLCSDYRANLTINTKTVEKSVGLITLSPTYDSIINDEVDRLNKMYKDLQKKYPLLLSDSWDEGYWVNYVNNTFKEEE